MLERIEEIQGIGLLHEANGKPHKWQKATIVYADNGRGKSTIATILRSLGLGEAAPILERKTIDGTLPPKVTLQFPTGHKVSFTSNKWSETRPEFSVFDSDFVETNVHSGGVVNTGHRKNLLQFALGATAVAARVAEEKATEDARKASGEVQNLVDRLSGHHEGMNLGEFEKLTAVADADKQLEHLEKRIVAARSSALLLKRPVPSPINVPALDLGPYFTVLGITMENVQDDAEATVRAHVTKLGKASAEAWLSQGQSFGDAATCPYCAQPTQGLDLIKAYRTHFNNAYTDLKTKVLQLDKSVSASCNDSLVKDFAQKVETSKSATRAWIDQVVVSEVGFDATLALTKLSELRSLLSDLVAKKQSSPTAAVGGDPDRLKAAALWADIVALMNAANAAISAARALIEEFRQRLSSDDVPALLGQQKQLGLTKKRHSAAVVKLVSDLTAARAASSTAEAAKNTARSKLDALMKQTLNDYQKSINELLAKFGATFQIEKMDANFRGGSPRSEYGLALRGKSVPLEGGPPSFGTALSEGDKRTLAFAFFIASTLADPKLITRIIVVDDPMCSFDLNRKQHTRTVLKEVCGKVHQLIVLAHDIYFVRDLRNDLTPKDGLYSVTVIGLRHAGNGYTTFDRLDVDRECQSPYSHHHNLLMEYVSNGAGDHRQIAKAIRPLLEGYLHRRFPGLIPTGQMFGQVLDHIHHAPAGSPISHAQCLVGELREINTYAGQFHHDTNLGNADTVHITPTELSTFSSRALRVIHKGNL